MKKKKFSLVVLILIGMLSYSFGAPYGDLQIVNNTLSDGNGNPVQLKGWSQLDLMQPDTGWVVGSTIPNLKALCQGLNAVRIAMYTSEFGYGYMDQNDSGKANYRQKVKGLINDAINADIYVLVDWHILNDSDPWSNSYYQGARAFFEDIAQSYGGYDNVLFELCNEPKQVSFSGTIKPFAEYVLEGIRNYSDNIAVVGTPTWSQDVDQVVGNKITSNVGRGIMYALHFYAGTHYQSLRDKGTTALNGGVPVMLSEWGTVSSSGDGSLDLNNSGTWLNWADQNNISWFNWSWSVRAESSAAIANGNLSGPWTYPNDLTQSGRWVYERLNSGITPPPIQTDDPNITPTPDGTPGPTPQPGTGNGLEGAYYSGTNFDSLVFIRTDGVVDFNWGGGAPDVSLPDDNYSVQWTGEIEAGYSETYTFYTYCDDGVRLYIDNNLLIDNWQEQAATEYSGSIDLYGGQRYSISMEYFESAGDAVAQLSWSSNSTPKEVIPRDRLYSGTIQPSNLGDVNNDGSVDIVDGLLIAQYYVNLYPDNFNPDVADVNCSGTIDIVDSLFIAQYYVGLPVNFC
ncbi:MAG: cellulase family glycosylhydrolase [Spirochaetales bacterium]|nr:cellulase family glycosylhydrolase [Spirochaetales bacterium]